ncbi:hypothetical protein ACKI10_18135 [Streptomyces galilaeus]|uniref:hypothetical protein n=1 Tax=Streptomyces galilaeus TaxID=33899 RepID=UPI0038F730B7
MTYVADADGAVWALSPDGVARCVYDPAQPDNAFVGILWLVEDVTANYGPLTPLPNWPPTLPA